MTISFSPIACTVASLAFLLLGFAVREAEANQIGTSDNASLWTFVLSGLCLYAAAVIGWTAFRRSQKRKGAGENLRSLEHIIDIHLCYLFS